MNGTIHSITCVTNQTQQKILLKSLVGIFGHRANSNDEWTYLDEGLADVVIIDYDEMQNRPMEKSKLGIYVGLSEDYNRIKHLSFTLQKPVRSRDLLHLLNQLDEHMQQQQASPFVQASVTTTAITRTPKPSVRENHLDTIFSLIKKNPESLLRICLDDQLFYLDGEKKKVFLPANFSYKHLAMSNHLTYRQVSHLPDEALKTIFLADFFYEFTLQQQEVKLLAELDKNCNFQLRQWPQFSNHQAKGLVRISAYFSKHKATLQKAAQDLSLGMEELIGFLNGVHAQNLLVFEAGMALNNNVFEPRDAATTVTTLTEETHHHSDVKPLGGLFSRIRQRLGI